jgi:predicted RNA-binding protein with PUA-like domain
MEVVETGLIDPSQFDPASPYFDPKASREAPRWDCVRLGYLRSFRQMLSLASLREQFDAEALPLVRRGNRLSILPVSEASALRIYGLLGEAP